MDLLRELDVIHKPLTEARHVAGFQQKVVVTIIHSNTWRAPGQASCVQGVSHWDLGGTALRDDGSPSARETGRCRRCLHSHLYVGKKFLLSSPMHQKSGPGPQGHRVHD